MKLWALPLLLLLAGWGCSTIPSHNDLRDASLTLKLGKAICSGAAIGPSMILTAQHCLKGGTLNYVNGQPVTAKRVIKGAGDRVIYELERPMFTRFAKIGPPPKQGDRIRFWGNPRGNVSWYRVGYVVAVEGEAIVIDAYACPGDSGAPLYSDAGLIVGVLAHLTVRSDTAECRFTVAITPLP